MLFFCWTMRRTPSRTWLYARPGQHRHIAARFPEVVPVRGAACCPPDRRSRTRQYPLGPCPEAAALGHLHPHASGGIVLGIPMLMAYWLNSRRHRRKSRAATGVLAFASTIITTWRCAKVSMRLSPWSRRSLRKCDDIVLLMSDAIFQTCQ